MHLRHIYLIFLFWIIPSKAQSPYREDFLEFWEDYNQNFAYFSEQQIDWNKVKDIYLPAFDTVKNNTEFVKLLEQVVNELHNGHISLNTNLSSSNKLIPSGSDIYAVMNGSRFYISDVRNGSGAESAGIRPDMEIIEFNSKPIMPQLQKFLPKSASNYTPDMYSYALNMLLAGTHDTNRILKLRDNGTIAEYYPDHKEKANSNNHLLSFEVLSGNIGYIKVNNSLGNYDLIAEFDAALDNLINTKSLILDLTETPGGGNTTVARAIMGRFVTKEMPYQKHVIYEKEFGIVRSWIEYEAPRGKIYTGKLVIMAGHWTGSMGEGIVIGFDAMKRAKITGTKMAGLLGAIYSFNAKNTNIGYQIPVEKMFHVNGQPREDYIPPYSTKNSAETYRRALELAK